MTGRSLLTSIEPRPGSRILPWLLASAFYLALALILTWPLAIELPTVLPHDLGDPVLNAWIVWWNAHAIPLTTKWWSPPIFWPTPGAFAFSETLLGLTWITTPMQWLGAGPITAYNVAFLVTFPLSALAAHALAFKLTGRHDAGAIAGLVYGFNPFRASHFPQIQVLTSYWMPVALLALHQYVSRRQIRWLVLFAAAWLMQSLSNGYYMLYFPVLLGLWTVWFVLSTSQVRTLVAVAGAALIGSLPLIPYLWQYSHILARFGMRRDSRAAESFGADLASLLDASPQLAFWHFDIWHQPEGELFPGLTAVLLVLLAIVLWLWRSRTAGERSRTCLVLLSCAVAFIAIALTPLVVGPWSLTIASVKLLSVGVVSKPLSIGVVLFLVALGFDPRFSKAWRQRSPLMFYVAATFLLYLLSLGPLPRFLGEPFMYRAPYTWLMVLPGFDAIRVPARFAMLAILCLSAAAGLSFARLTARWSTLARMTLALVAMGGVLFDSWLGAMPLQALPVRLQALEAALPAGAVMELPLGEVFADAAAMYRSIYHHRPIINGYSGYSPPSYTVLKFGLSVDVPGMLDAVTASGPVLIAVDRQSPDGARWAAQIAARSGTIVLGEESGRRLFALAGGTALPPEVATAQPLRIQSVTANVHPERTATAIDGNPATRWESGPQRGTEVVTIDLGATRVVDAVTLDIGPYLTDYPRRLVIEALTGDTWSTQWEGNAAMIAFAAATRHPLEPRLTFAMPHVSTRQLRLRQLGQDQIYYWTIVELKVYGH